MTDSRTAPTGHNLNIHTENYLKTIWNLSRLHDSPHKLVHNSQLAEELRVKRPTVCEMLQRLSDMDLVELVPRKGVKLSSKGEGVVLEALAKKKKVLIIGHSLDQTKLLHANAALDPHTWFDPALWIETANILAKNPPTPQVSSASLEEFTNNVYKVANQYKEEFKKVPKEKRILITSHDAFQYLGRFFEIEVQGVQGVSTDSEIGVKRIDELIALIKARKIGAIFTETSVSARSIQKLISESGAKNGGILYSDALGPPGSNADTYVGMLEHNLKTILSGMNQ